MLATLLISLYFTKKNNAGMILHLLDVSIGQISPISQKGQVGRTSSTVVILWFWDFFDLSLNFLKANNLLNLYFTNQ